MPRGWRPCPKPGCPEPIPPNARYCDTHLAEYEAKRGTTTGRGYGHAHQELRAKWARRVRAGIVSCWRCGCLIKPDEAWDLGHDDADRSRYRGPEHASRCNRSAAGRKAHKFE